jgi:hypothetical protein
MPPNVPAARIVRQRGVQVTPRSVPLRQRAAAAYDALGDGPRGFIAAVVGLWPITAVMLLALGMCWAAVVAG